MGNFIGFVFLVGMIIVVVSFVFFIGFLFFNLVFIFVFLVGGYFVVYKFYWDELLEFGIFFKGFDYVG